MGISRRQKYMGHSHNVSYSDKKVDICFDIKTLDIMCSYVISENRTIKRTPLINMRNLFACLDMDVYKGDIEKIKKINFIKKGIEGRLVKNLQDKRLIVQYINGGIIDDLTSEIISSTVLNTNEINFVNETVSSALKYTFIYNDIDLLYDTLTAFKAADYVSKQMIVEQIETIITQMQNKFRRVKVESLSDTEFSLSEDKFEDNLRDIYNKLTNPSNTLRTGMQGMNEMLGGGFKSSRTYMFLGLTGGGKSLTLLDLVYQIKQYNKDYKCKDPSKTPVIVYLTMENTVEETVERLFDMLVSKGDINNFTFEEVLEMLKNDGELYIDSENPINIMIKYKPNLSIDTSYLYTICEDLEDEGYEVIAFVQDHIGRIRSSKGLASDPRLELGAIADDFHVFCQLKDIPFITNFHLNRDAASKIDEAARCNKSDLIRLLGRANVSESLLMINNFDGCFMLNQEFDKNGNKFMGLMRTKKRFKASERNVLFFPYTGPNSIKLVEDLNDPVPSFRTSLREEETVIDFKLPPTIKQSPYQGNIKSIDDLMGDKQLPNVNHIDIFDNQTPVATCGNRVMPPTQPQQEPKKEKPLLFSRIPLVVK